MNEACCSEEEGIWFLVVWFWLWFRSSAETLVREGSMTAGLRSLAESILKVVFRSSLSQRELMEKVRVKTRLEDGRSCRIWMVCLLE